MNGDPVLLIYGGQHLYHCRATDTEAGHPLPLIPHEWLSSEDEWAPLKTSNLFSSPTNISHSYWNLICYMLHLWHRASPGHCWWRWCCQRGSRHQRRRWRRQTHPGTSNKGRQASGGEHSLQCPWDRQAQASMLSLGVWKKAGLVRSSDLTCTRRAPSSVSP